MGHMKKPFPLRGKAWRRQKSEGRKKVQKNKEKQNCTRNEREKGRGVQKGESLLPNIFMFFFTI